MDDATNNEGIQLPAGTKRVLRGFKPELRRCIYEAVYEKIQTLEHGSVLVMTDLQECISVGWNNYQSRKAIPFPDPDYHTMTASLEDFKAGRFQEVQEVIDELQGRNLPDGQATGCGV